MSDAGAAAQPGAGPSAPPRPLGPLLAGFALDAALALVLLLLASLAAGAAWIVIEIASGAAPGTGASGEPGPLAELLMAMAGVSVPALVLYFWRRRADAGERLRSRQAAARPRTWLLASLVGAGCFASASVVTSLAAALGVEPMPSNQGMVEAGWQRWPAFMALFAVVLAPAYEELLFRRVLFGRFLAGGRPWLGLALSSVAFALLHEIPGLSGNDAPAMLQLWLVYGGLGAAFAWVYWRTGTLWAPLAAHALNNALALAAYAAGAA
ncbi:MAG TPA: CPBP family intramembrane glutamic endopeptidase [Pseudoxanthomonas sp.]|nr:CPBP family intramembrane glutamic endopeptidase [Pseudoxanthomonas sp.]